MRFSRLGRFHSQCPLISAGPEFPSPLPSGSFSSLVMSSSEGSSDMKTDHEFHEDESESLPDPEGKQPLQIHHEHQKVIPKQEMCSMLSIEMVLPLSNLPKN